ncbi:cytoskeletal motor fibril protein Fib [Spiroplasma endosymbiont of Crioceris asparagi]|uniref:cytoskeletal motor fibril protein Fib n=1 Tax=Spiroplasma endosymbiont of Crioceris asparagi TaxID=3066286 RepID=UPI0030CC9EB9
MIAIISTTYFEYNIQNIKGKFTVKEKFWWKNVLIQRIETKSNNYLIVTCGYGKANAAMALTYIIEKFPNVKTIINVDIALSTNSNLKTGDVILGNNFIYHDSDLTIFEDVKFGQILNEPDVFSFDDKNLSNKLKNLKMGFKTGVIGTADTLIYNSKQLKELIDKFGYSIDVIDTEAGVFAQIANKSNIDFASIKVVFNNALSSWENDPLKSLRIQEAINKMKFIILKIMIFMSTKLKVKFKGSTEAEVDIYSDLTYYFQDEWLKNYVKKPAKIVFEKPPLVFVFNKKNLVAGSIELVNIDNKVTNNDFLNNYFQEYRSDSGFWNERNQYLAYINIDKEDILFNKSTRNKPQTKRFTIEQYAQFVCKKIQEECAKKEKISYKGVVIANRNLIVNLKIKPSYYIADIKNKRLIQDKKIASVLFKTELSNLFNKYLKSVESPYKKITILIKLPYAKQKLAQLFLFNSCNKINQRIKFKEIKKPRKYKDMYIVDILRSDNDTSKFGDISINLDMS